MTNLLPQLYTFRRCPYAMRARMAIHYSGIKLTSIEVSLKDKPQRMLDASPKGTVPVLVLASGEVIDESRDVMMWALRQSDPDGWMFGLPVATRQRIDQLIDDNDYKFKPALDKYKYSVRYPEQPAEYYRSQGEAFLSKLESMLKHHQFLMGEQMSLADIALFPFIRQFAFVDKAWFDTNAFSRVREWLNYFLDSSRFIDIMKKL